MSTRAMARTADDIEIYPQVTSSLCDEIVRRILSVGKPLKVVLFGSRARGDHKPDSDIDILVIEQTPRATEVVRRQYDESLRGVYPEYTLILHSLSDVEEWQDVPNHLISAALSEGELLYEDSAALREMVCTPVGLRVAEGKRRRTQEDLARLWFKRANDDLSLCQKLVDDEKYYGAVCFHAQQAAEKYLKGLLALHKFRVKKTHDLEELVKLCSAILPAGLFAQLKLEMMSKYYWEPRYSMDFEPGLDTAKEALEHAKQMREIVLDRVPDSAKPGR